MLGDNGRSFFGRLTMSREAERLRRKLALWAYTVGFFGLLFLVGQAVWEGDFLVALLLAFITGVVK